MESLEKPPELGTKQVSPVPAAPSKKAQLQSRVLWRCPRWWQVGGRNEAAQKLGGNTAQLPGQANGEMTLGKQWSPELSTGG